MDKRKIVVESVVELSAHRFMQSPKFIAGKSSLDDFIEFAFGEYIVAYTLMGMTSIALSPYLFKEKYLPQFQQYLSSYVDPACLI